MRFLRLVPLLALPFLFLGATCVTKVEQKGPTGPWVGEVTNMGPDVQTNVYVTGNILDANGTYVEPVTETVCPLRLRPGEKGYFTAPNSPLYAISHAPFLVQPFHLSLKTFSDTWPKPLDQISFKVLGTYPEDDAILVEMQNSASETYYPIGVCAINFAPSGEARETSWGSPFLPIQPGEARDFVVHFDSPLDGTFEFSAKSLQSHGDTFIDSPPFVYTTRVVRTDEGRKLQVVGEVTNTSNNDLQHARFQAYLESSPAVRIEGAVATTKPGDSATHRGSGVIPAGQKTLLAFTLPFDANDTPMVKIEGLVGQTPAYTMSPVSARNVVSHRMTPGTIKVTASLQNPTDEGLIVDSLCFNLRNGSDKLVGGQCGRATWVGPHDSVTVSQDVMLVAAHRAPSVEVLAYGHPGPEPTKTAQRN